jgi:hypothetical protein
VQENKRLETIMSLHRSFAAALWVLAAAGAWAVAASWAGDAQTGKVHPWALVALFWGAAAVSVTIHYLSRYLADQVAQAPSALGHYRRSMDLARHALTRSRAYLARTWEVLSRPRIYVPDRRGAFDGLAPYLARGTDVLRRTRAHLPQARDLMPRMWRQDSAAAAPGAAPAARVVEIGS